MSTSDQDQRRVSLQRVETGKLPVDETSIVPWVRFRM